MMPSITDRMKAARAESDLTVSDMAIWFNVTRASMNSWIVGHHEPHKNKLSLLEEQLLLLERVLIDPKAKGFLPVPLYVRQYERKAYVEKVKTHAAKEFSPRYSAGRRK